MTATECPGHAGLADDLRTYATTALDQLEPWLDRVREQQPGPAGPEPASCTVCPVCAVITVLRGGRSELAVRFAEQAVELVTVLRAALEEGIGAVGRPPHDGSASNGSGPGSSATGSSTTKMSRTVQYIPVDREDGWPSHTPC